MDDPAIERPVMMSPPGARVVVDGETFDYFGGTGYLGLQGHPEVIDAACRAAKSFGVHTATSRSRYASQPVLNVERLVAEFFDTESAFYFVSGYVANSLLVQAVGKAADAVFVDEHAHYSVTESARLVGAPVHAFRSRDPEDLHKQIREQLGVGARPLVMTDGVFPSFGWIAPIDEYADVLHDFPGAMIMIDDAHGFGTIGPNGRGTLDHFGMFETANRVTNGGADLQLFVVGTASKALGGHGGIVPGDRKFIELATTASHYYDGASAPAAPIAAATARALQLVIGNPTLRTDLARNVARVRTGLREIGIDNDDLPTPVVGFTRGDAAAMRKLSDDLAASGILVPYTASYSGLGPEGAMRLAVFATHTDEQIDRLLETLRGIVNG